MHCTSYFVVFEIHDGRQSVHLAHCTVVVYITHYTLFTRYIVLYTTIYTVYCYSEALIKSINQCNQSLNVYQSYSKFGLIASRHMVAYYRVARAIFSNLPKCVKSSKMCQKEDKKCVKKEDKSNPKLLISVHGFQEC